THSVDLDVYTLTQLTVLRDTNGQEYAALAWENPEGGGHHRSGVLRFPGVTSSGTKIAELPFFEVVIRGVGDVPERVLRWELVSQG
ncbi:MAG: hypothetical protein HY335_10090, partial [Deinococcus sp.]|nr:hypothetical protein [Deinococcus sp.]